MVYGFVFSFIQAVEEDVDHRTDRDNVKSSDSAQYLDQPAAASRAQSNGGLRYHLKVSINSLLYRIVKLLEMMSGLLVMHSPQLSNILQQQRLCPR